jgi:membrane protein DedA with SNARE-associated domain
MWDLIGQIVALVADNPWLATGVAFAAAIVEAVAVLGILLPGTPILMAVAGAVAMAGLPITPILIVSIVGAVIGDGISFWFGYRYRHRLAGMWPFRTRPGLLLAAQAFFARYGATSVALCRFVPVLRSTVPLVAGMAGMAKGRFLLANVASALVWAPAHVLPAQFAGLSVKDLREGDWKTAALLGAIVLASAAALFALHRLGTSPAFSLDRWTGARRKASGEPPAR